MDPSPKKITLSVHELVDFLFRRGDIDDRIYNTETMQLGSKLHRSFQEKQGHDYLSEVPLSETFEVDGYEVTLEGRADGIIVGGEMPIIDEIKSTVAPLREFYEQQRDWHLSQAECYALMYAHAYNARKVLVRLTYISQTESDERLVKEAAFTEGQLQKDVIGYIGDFLSFHKALYDRIASRDASAGSLPFPFATYRPGQEEMCEKIYNVALRGGHLLCEAPTGIGKTASALYPAVKSFSKGANDKIFYLTAKGTGAESAEKAMGLLLDEGLDGVFSTLRAKEKMCLSPGSDCNPDSCPFAKGYYDKLKEARAEALASDGRLTADYVLSLAERRAMCPFEFQLDLSLYSDVIICDYNYLFDPLVKLDRFFGPEADPRRYLALVDEAHNLPERARDMHSASLSLLEANEAKDSIRRIKAPAEKRALTKLITALEDQAALLSEEHELYDEVPSAILTAASALESARAKAVKKGKPRPKMPMAFRDFSRAVHRFVCLAEDYLDGAQVYAEAADGDFAIRIYCLDPGPRIRDAIEPLHGAVFFSGTLSPIPFYAEEMGFEEGVPILRLPSPFPPENVLYLFAPKVSTRYRDRASTYPEVAAYLKAFVGAKKGNYFVYMPSYAYLKSILPYLDFGDADVLVQKRSMSEADKASFLASFRSSPEKTVVGLLIIGGTFAEGIDLVGDRLIGVAVVGVGLPQISFERDLIRAHYDESGERKGYEFAYMDPGINKVTQAVGRLIRSETDRGAAIFIDDRYLTRWYRDVFEGVSDRSFVAYSPEEAASILRDFYHGGGGD
jgi:Rad3-related DNA helicase